MNKLLLIFVLVPLLLTASEFTKTGESVEPQQGIPLFLKIITYDDNFTPEKYEGVTVFLIYDRANADSYEQTIKTQEFFKANPNLQVAKLAVELRPMTVDQIRSGFGSLSDSRYYLVLFTSISGESVRKSVDLCQTGHIRSFSFVSDQLAAGVAVSIMPSQKKNAIVINLEAARAEGSAFSARLLQMCEIYKGTG